MKIVRACEIRDVFGMVSKLSRVTLKSRIRSSTEGKMV